MPFLKFKCESCGKVFDELVKLSDVEALRCPDCGGKVRRVLSPQGLETEGDELRFTLSLTQSVPPKADGGGAGGETMQVLHWNESN